MRLTIEQVMKDGYRLVRGRYAGAERDRIDRWYWQQNGKDCSPRRGPGYSSIMKALEGLARHLDRQKGLGI